MVRPALDLAPPPRPESADTPADPGRRRALIAGASGALLAGCGGGGGVATADTQTQTGGVPPASRAEASRFLQQATFGPRSADIPALMSGSYDGWLATQMAMPHQPVYVDAMQAWFDRGADFRPDGPNYTPDIVTDTFWKCAVEAPDALRARVVHSLIQIFVVSFQDSGLYDHGRAVAGYLDMLGGLAFGNFRDLLEAVALSPVMGMYLSHIRNQKADARSGRKPDENFARELMQLFSIGVQALNEDGSTRLGADGQPVETYGIHDVEGLARVFTGWSWDMPDEDDYNSTFLWNSPKFDTTGSARADLRPMRIYADFHAPEAKSFLGVTIPAGTSGPKSLRIALDTLFQHPNAGPFIGRQLIQRLVTSNPSPSYVARVSRAFADNGAGVRGDMKAVLRAVLLDDEARGAPGAEAGRVRDPVQRTAHWARSLGARSLTGHWMMGWDLRGSGQQALHSPSVFNFYRPGYVPPNSAVATKGLVAPELQIANESTLAEWVNFSYALSTWGTGWTGERADLPASQHNKSDVALDYDAPGSVIRSLIDGGTAKLIDRINLLMYAGAMSSATRVALLGAVDDVQNWNGLPRQAEDQVRLAVFLTLASPDYLMQR